MTQFDSLPTGYSQASVGNAKPPASPQGKTDSAFAQFWSAQNDSAAAAPPEHDSAEGELPPQEPVPKADVEVEDTPTPAEIGLHPEMPRLDGDPTTQAATEGDPAEAIAAKSGNHASAVERKIAADLQGAPAPAIIEAESPDQQTALPEGQLSGANGSIYPQTNANLALAQSPQGDPRFMKDFKLERALQTPDKANKAPQMRPETAVNPAQTAAQQPPLLPVDAAAQAANQFKMPAGEGAATTPDMSFVPDGGLAPTPQTQSAQHMAQTAVINRAHAAQVAQQITAAIVQTSGSTTEIMLNPEELGRVRIAMTTGDAGITVTLMAERPETTELMRRNIEHLTRELSDMGYENPTFNFENQSGETGEDWGDAAPVPDLPADLPVADPAIITRQHVALSGGLDLKL